MAGKLDPHAAEYLRATNQPDAPAISALSPAEMREAVVGLIKEFGGVPETVARVEEQEIAGPAGSIPIKIYTPHGNGPHPVLVYFHGGGWVFGDITTHECHQFSCQ
jgi:acetyl esterase